MDAPIPWYKRNFDEKLYRSCYRLINRCRLLYAWDEGVPTKLILSSNQHEVILSTYTTSVLTDFSVTATCAFGKNQSPQDIDSFSLSTLHACRYMFQSHLNWNILLKAFFFFTWLSKSRVQFYLSQTQVYTHSFCFNKISLCFVEKCVGKKGCQQNRLIFTVQRK